MSAVTYKDGVATILSRHRKTEVHVLLTALLALEGGVTPSATDMKALAIGFKSVTDERDKLHDELAKARELLVGQPAPAAVPDDSAILKHALDAITVHFDTFVGECMDANRTRSVAPPLKALMQARACLPASCVNAFPAKKGGAA